MHHQSFFIPLRKSWEINFSPRTKSNSDSIFKITCTNLTSTTLDNSYLYLINIPATSGSVISTSGSLNQISNSIVLGTFCQHETSFYVSDFPKSPCSIYILDDTTFLPPPPGTGDQCICVSFVIEERFRD